MKQHNKETINQFGTDNIGMDINTPHARCDVSLGQLHTMLDKHFIMKYVIPNISPERLSNLAILDVGAGKGRMTREFMKMAPKCVAIEPFQPFFEALRENCKSVEMYPYTLDEYVEVAKDKFDIIFIGGVIFCLSDDELLVFLENAKRLLRNEGFLVIREAQPYKNWQRDCKYEILRSWDVLASFFNRAGFQTISLHRAYPINIPSKLYLSWPNSLTSMLWKIASHDLTYPFWRILADLNILPKQSQSYLHYLVRINK